MAVGTSKPRGAEREPVRIKIYGLVYMTRQGYLILLIISLVFAIGLLAVRLWGPLPLEPAEQRDLTIYDKLAYGLLDNLHWIVVGAVVLGVVEAIVVLRRFSREELLQRALLDDPPALESKQPETPVP